MECLWLKWSKAVRNLAGAILLSISPSLPIQQPMQWYFRIGHGFAAIITETTLSTAIRHTVCLVRLFTAETI